MADVAVIAKLATEGTRQALVLTEDRLGHYLEFSSFFAQTFDLDRIGRTEPGFLRAPSGMNYALVLRGRNGDPFLWGLEVYAIVEGLRPLDDKVVDRDLWATLERVIARVGAPWPVEDPQETGQLYRILSAS